MTYIKSNYYIKGNIGGKKVRIDITDENVYTACPICGKEHQVDLADIFETGVDLYGTQVYCGECVRRQTKRME